MDDRDSRTATGAKVADGDRLVALLEGATALPAEQITRAVHAAGRAIGAQAARLLVADYALATLQELGLDGPTGYRQPIDGTLVGRAFINGEAIVSSDDPTVAWVPLSEGSERIGVLELRGEGWSDDALRDVDAIARILVLVLISKRRYTDVVLRSRRAEPLSVAAEMQWDLLPPLTCSTDRASVSGILEPAYAIGGDSFDYAFNPAGVDFALVDACGRGLGAVLMSVAAITSLRNARREGVGLEAAYRATDELIESQFGSSYFVTGQFGTLDVGSGELTWLNAGHPLPLLVRNGSFVGELPCEPSKPMGLGGAVHEVATEHLQPGDRVLFYSDGVTETRAPSGAQFGVERLADFLVRATLDDTSPAETVRRLSAAILGYNNAVLGDDATLMLLAYHGVGDHGTR